MAENSVLVVDDDKDILNIVEEILSHEGYTVSTAANGLEALGWLKKQRPGLILLDMRMPVMDGWQFTSNLRIEYDKHIPVVVMTAAKDARQRAREVDAEGYIAKPFDIDHLLATVREHMRN